MPKTLIQNLSSFMYNPNFTIVKGVAGAQEALLPYPEGYNRDNTLVINYCIRHTNNYNYFFHNQSTAVYCDDKGIHVWFMDESHAFRNSPVWVYIAKSDKPMAQDFEIIACGSTEKITGLTTTTSKDFVINIPVQVDIDYQVLFTPFITGARSTQFSFRLIAKTLSYFKMNIQSTFDMVDNINFYLDYLVVRSNK